MNPPTPYLDGFFLFSLDKIEDGDFYPAGKLTCGRNPRAWLSGMLFLRNECLLNNCRTLKDQQQQQDNKYAFASLLPFSPLLSLIYFAIPTGITACA